MAKLKLCPVRGAANALIVGGLLMFPAIAWSQAPATFTPDSLPFTGFKKTAHITVTSPYNDCTMAISTTAYPDASFLTVDPPGPLIGLGPFTFTVTSGTKAGSG